MVVVGNQDEIILKNCRTFPFSEPRDIAIKDGIITEVGTVQDDGVDCKGRIVMPGFVNIHTHLDKADLLSLISASMFGTLEQNRETVRRLKKNYEHGEVKERARKVALEMLAQGCTCIRTQVDVDDVAGQVAVDALAELREELSGFIDLQVVAFPQQGLSSESNLKEFEESLSKVDAVGGLPAVEKTLEERRQHIDTIFELAKKHGLEVDAQIDEANDSGQFLLPYFTEKTVDSGMQGRVTATHCLSLSAVDDETARKTIAGLREACINVSVTPSPNISTSFPTATRANSITRVNELLDAGVNVALGTDNIRDIFYPIGSGSMLREMHVMACAIRAYTDDNIEDYFKMASVNGAKIMGQEYAVKEGARADLIVLNGMSLREALNNLPIIPVVVKEGNIVATNNLETEVIK